jgi:hypothetical protein
VSPHRSLKQFRRSSPPSLHWVPRVGPPASSVLRGDRTPRRPSRRASFPSLGDTAAIQRSETTRSPRFLEDPRTRALLFDPGGTGAPGHRGRLPYSSARRCCLPHLRRRRLPRLTPFEAQSHGPRPRCLRFAARVAPGPRKTRFRLVTFLRRSGFEPAGSHRKVSAQLFMAFSFPRLSWRTAGRVKARGAHRHDRRRRLGLEAPEHAGTLVVFPSEDTSIAGGVSVRVGVGMRVCVGVRVDPRVRVPLQPRDPFPIATGPDRRPLAPGRAYSSAPSAG